MPAPEGMSEEAFAWARDVDRRVAAMTAGSFYALAKEIVDALGKEEGKALIRRAMRKYGLAGGRRKRQMAEAAGLPLDRQGFLASGGDAYALGWEFKEAGEVAFCPIVAVWQAMGSEALELGYLFCEVDFALVEGFNPELELRRPLCIAKGDAVCKFIIGPKQES